MLIYYVCASGGLSKKETSDVGVKEMETTITGVVLMFMSAMHNSWHKMSFINSIRRTKIQCVVYAIFQ